MGTGALPLPANFRRQNGNSQACTLLPPLETVITLRTVTEGGTCKETVSCLQLSCRWGRGDQEARLSLTTKGPARLAPGDTKWLLTLTTSWPNTPPTTAQTGAISEKQQL